MLGDPADSRVFSPEHETCSVTTVELDFIPGRNLPPHLRQQPGNVLEFFHLNFFRRRKLASSESQSAWLGIVEDSPG